MLFILTNCSDIKTDEYKTSIDTINYLDFKFSKVIAFATVDPFAPAEMYMYSTKKMNLSKFGDTISRTLDNSQIDFLAKILSGKLNRDTLPDPADCHNPRHNIIFLNDKDSVLNYISVCFECITMRSSKPHKASFNNFADFFNSLGLKVFDRPDYYKQYYDSLNKLRPNRKSVSTKDSVIKFMAPVEQDN